MKTRILVLAAILVLLADSCATVGVYRPASKDDRVIGLVYTTFTARDPWLNKKEVINTHVYIKLLEAAVQKYPGEIDIRDIVWTTGKYFGGIWVEISAAGKVISIGTDTGPFQPPQ
jgi:hypothetical protein